MSTLDESADYQANRWNEMLANADFGSVVRAVFESREAAERGEFCDCSEPVGDGLSCGRCLRQSKSQELAAVHRLVDAHDFVSGRLGFCGICMCAEDAPRHHGQPAEGRTSWGERVAGASAEVEQEKP